MNFKHVLLGSPFFWNGQHLHYNAGWNSVRVGEKKKTLQKQNRGQEATKVFQTVHSSAWVFQYEYKFCLKSSCATSWILKQSVMQKIWVLLKVSIVFIFSVSLNTVPQSWFTVFSTAHMEKNKYSNLYSQLHLHFSEHFAPLAIHVWLFQWAIYSHDYIKGNLQQVLPLSKKWMFTSKGSWWAWGWEHLDRAHVPQANNNHSRHAHQTRITRPDREHTVDCWAIKAAAISCCIPSRSWGSPQIQ